MTKVSNPEAANDKPKAYGQHQPRAINEQAQRRDDHPAPAIDVAERAEHRRDRCRGQQIGGDDPGQAGDVLELPADGRQRGRDNGLVERGQEHRHHQAHQDGAGLGLRQRRARRKQGRIVDREHLSRKLREFGLDRLSQSLGIGRETALPFVLVHHKMLVRSALVERI